MLKFISSIEIEQIIKEVCSRYENKVFTQFIYDEMFKELYSEVDNFVKVGGYFYPNLSISPVNYEESFPKLPKTFKIFYTTGGYIKFE